MRITNRSIASLAFRLLMLVALAGNAYGQSLDISAPAPISTQEVAGRIVARDLGDSRLTDHYYAFAARPGDLVVIVESRNLNGDIDIFTSGTLRPLMKFTLYAEGSAPISKSIFLRKREDLVLRVQARTPNDDEGVYQVRFGGSFEPLPENPLLAQTETRTDAAPTARPGSRRVSSVGARLPEPEPTPAEVAAAPTPEPTPEATPTATPAPVEETAKVETPTPPARNTRARRPANRRTPRSRPPAEPARTAETETAKTSETETAKPTEQPEKPATTTDTTPTASSPRRSSSRRKTPAETTQEPAEPDTGPRLVIETADGTLIDRSMSTVRRVMVENGQVVVVGKDGRVIRVQLAQVVKMSIAPQ